MKNHLPLTITHEEENVKFQNITRSIKFDRTNQIATFIQDFIIEEKGLTRKEYEEHTYRLFHPQEFRYFLESNGFSIEIIYGEPDTHKEFDEASNKMIFVAIKK